MSKLSQSNNSGKSANSKSKFIISSIQKRSEKLRGNRSSSEESGASKSSETSNSQKFATTKRYTKDNKRFM